MSEPLSEERIREMEARANAAGPPPWTTGESFGYGGHFNGVHAADGQELVGEFGMTDEAAALLCDVPALIAEVRRLRALFPDPEADAALLERSVESDDWSIEDSEDLRDLAARIRQVTGEQPTDGAT